MSSRLRKKPYLTILVVHLTALLLSLGARAEDFNDFDLFDDQPPAAGAQETATPPTRTSNNSQPSFNDFDLFGEATGADSSSNVQRPQTNRNGFDLSNRTFFGAGRRRSGYQWNGCSPTAAVTGSFGKNNMNKCANNSASQFNVDFGNHLEQNFMPCVRRASKDAGIKEPTKVFLNMGSVRANRGKNGCGSCGGWSQHAYGRALDIYAFNLYDEGGKRISHISALGSKYGGQNRLFYDSFNKCWERTVRKKCGKKSGTIVHTHARTSLRKQGYKFYANGAHWDHIHLAYPNGCSR